MLLSESLLSNHSIPVSAAEVKFPKPFQAIILWFRPYLVQVSLPLYPIPTVIITSSNRYVTLPDNNST